VHPLEKAFALAVALGTLCAMSRPSYPLDRVGNVRIDTLERHCVWDVASRKERDGREGRAATVTLPAERIAGLRPTPASAGDVYGETDDARVSRECAVEARTGGGKGSGLTLKPDGGPLGRLGDLQGVFDCARAQLVAVR